GQLAEVGASVDVMATAPPQLSVAVAEPVLLGAVDAPHWSCLSAGQAITGAVVSTKSMCWTQVEKFPHPSVAFQVRSIPAFPVQLAGVGASVDVMATAPPQLSVAVAEPVVAGAVDAPHWSCLSAGEAITGAVVSTKTMCWTQVEEFPHPSVAFQVRSTPASPAHPAGVGASVNVTAGVPPQLSVAVAEPAVAGAVDAPHWSCLSA